jgi:nitrogen-specific signal transduction histidine kinase/ActR/RegA family two-component response regulator
MVLSDVTNERAQQRYQQSQERLATVGQLAAGIAHDFNNILAVITLYTQLLRQTAQLPEKHMRQLATIDEQAQHAVNLIGQILDFSHRSVMDLAPIDLLPITKALCKLLERILPDSIRVKIKYEQKAYVIMGDPTRLQQALMNLALNAQDAMPEGGELLFAFSEVNVAEDSTPPLMDMEPGLWVKLAVTDSGMGVQPEHLSRLFEPFFTTKERGKGTGLGLAQVYGIVKQHHGYIDVQSEVGKGTTFTLYLPRLLAEAVSTGETVALVDSLEGNETILVAEDNADLRQSVKEALVDLGYTVLLAENGRSALTTLSTTTQPIHMIVTDWSMPEIGGAKFVQTLHEQYPNLHILIMSGYPLGMSDEVLQLPNVAGWLQKPFSIDALLLKIRQAFDQTA